MTTLRKRSKPAPSNPVSVPSAADIDHIKDLKPDERNARRHNPRNIGMIETALNEVGAARSIVIDEDGRILAGNGTVEAAAQAGITRVKVVEADGNELVAVRRRGLTARQKQRLALFDNRTAELADWQPEQLEDYSLIDKTVLDGIMSENEFRGILEHAGQIPVVRNANGEEVGPTSIGGVRNPLWLKHVQSFESANEFGFPDLRPELIYSPPDGLVTHCKRDNESAERLFVWMSDPLTKVNCARSVLCYYTLDAKFEGFVEFPAEHVEMILDRGWAAVVSPNLSLLPSMSRIEQMWRVFICRRFARYCQAVGIAIVPDVEWINKSSFEFSVLGIPDRPESVSVQLQTRLTTADEVGNCEQGLNEMHNRLHPKSVLVYGANPFWRKRCAEIFHDSRLVLCESFHERSRRLLKEERSKHAGNP